MSETKQGTMTMWRASKWGLNQIEEVPNVTRITESSMFTRAGDGKQERKHALRSEYGYYFCTREEAIAHRRTVLLRQIESRVIALRQAEADLAKFEEQYGRAE